MGAKGRPSLACENDVRTCTGCGSRAQAPHDRCYCCRTYGDLEDPTRPVGWRKTRGGIRLPVYEDDGSVG